MDTVPLPRPTPTNLAFPKVAFLLPAFNEEAAIAKVVDDARRIVPDAQVYVYDNNSTDRTAAVAAAAGATVRREFRQGKGAVVRRMFADIEADIYVMVDADDTYELAVVPEMIAMMRERQLDMVVGVRKPVGTGIYRPGHEVGNRLFTWAVRRLFGASFTDIFSGLRVFSRRFVKSFPVTARGFDIETLMTIHALELRLPCAEVAVPFRDRPDGGESKLRTVRDGTRILLRILQLLKDTRPFLFFSCLAAASALASLLVGTPVVLEFLATGLVDRLPSAVLASGMAVLSAIALSVGLTLDTVSRRHVQEKLLAYLAQRAPE